MSLAEVCPKCGLAVPKGQLSSHRCGGGATARTQPVRSTPVRSTPVRPAATSGAATGAPPARSASAKVSRTLQGAVLNLIPIIVTSGVGAGFAWLKVKWALGFQADHPGWSGLIFSVILTACLVGAGALSVWLADREGLVFGLSVLGFLVAFGLVVGTIFDDYAYGFKYLGKYLIQVIANSLG